MGVGSSDIDIIFFTSYPEKNSILLIGQLLDLQQNY
jgi:hypothetical protein